MYKYLCVPLPVEPDEGLTPLHTTLCGAAFLIFDHMTSTGNFTDKLTILAFLV